MALTHAASGELLDIRPLGPALPAAKSRTLVQSPSLESSGWCCRRQDGRPHRVPGAITVQCLEGAIEFEAHGRLDVMRAVT